MSIRFDTLIETTTVLSILVAAGLFVSSIIPAAAHFLHI